MPRERMRRSVERAVRVIDPWVEHRRALARVPGVSVGIVCGDEIVFRKGYGYADIARRIPAKDTTCYRIASISKTFTATAVMQFVEAGTCRLDDPVQTYVPWFRSQRDPKLARITLRHLLTHTAGIERDGNTAHWINDRFPTVAELREHVAEGVTIYRPYETFKYSNLGYAILGEVISAISGQAYEDHLMARIIRPLGLRHTFPGLAAPIRKVLAVGYGRDMPPGPRRPLPQADTRAMTAAAGLTSNAVDLCRYMSAQFLGNRTLLSDESKREMQRVHWLNAKAESHYGIGFAIGKVGDRQVVGHDGGFSGFITRLGMDVQSRVGVVVLTNALDGLAAILMNGIFHTIHHIAGHDVQFRPSGRRPIDFARYEGRFRSRWNDLIVAGVGRRLLAFSPQDDRPLENCVALESLEGGRFRIGSGSEFGYLGEQVVFRFGRRGRVSGLSWGPNPMEVMRA